jgi:diaminopimelate epimerase
MQLIVTLDAEPDTDTEDLERLTRQLRDELSELDVQADLVTGGSAPANTKAGDVIEWGTLLLTLAASGGVITALINAIQTWLTNRNQPATVTVEMGGDKLQITGNPSPEQRRLIEAFLHHHRSE